MTARKQATEPERVVTTKYTGNVRMTGTGSPTLDDLLEFVDAARKAGAQYTDGVEGTLNRGVLTFDAKGRAIHGPTTVNLYIDVPAGPVCNG